MNKEVLKMISDAANESNISLNLSKVTGDETLAQLNLDSLNSIAIIVAIENKHGFHIADEDLTNIKTIGEFVKVIEHYLHK